MRRIPTHFLGGNKRKMLAKHLCFFDCETYEEPIDINYKGNGTTFILKLRLGWLNYVRTDDDGNIKSDIWKKFTTIDEFWSFMDKFTAKREPVFCFAHNIDFDMNIVNSIVETARRGWEGRSPLWSGRVYIWSLKSPKGRSFRFLDSMNFTGGFVSLKKIGEALDLPKLDIDGSHIGDYSDEEVSTYCHRDVEIVREYILHWLKFNRDHNCGHFCNTPAAQTLSAYQHKNATEIDPKTGRERTPILIHGNPELSMFERDAYRGGWVECFYLGSPGKKTYKLDVSSFHPAIMKDEKLPYRTYSKTIVEPSERIIEMVLKEDRPFIMEADIYSPDRLIPIKIKDKGLVFPVGTYRANFTSLEYKRLIEIGGKTIKIYRIQEYEEMNLFKEYMEEFYAVKEKYAREGNKVFKDLAKYFMNSLEGKFAEHNENLEVIGDFPDPDFVGHEQRKDENGKKFNARIFGGKIYKTAGYKAEGFNAFIPISCFIRSKTRVLLSKWFQIVREAGGETYYCDTDSLFVDEIGYQALKKAGLIDEFELGKLKVEGISDDVEFRNLKDYRFGTDSKTKGKSKNAEDQEDGSWTQTKFLRTKGMIQRHVTGGVVIIKDYKIKRKGIYRKGTITKSGWVKPLVMPLVEAQQKLEM